ncbi:unnamed protein product [Strongylus vulgaris]|uniref:Transthyretin-like family protein n=1 Tax=Strongylus vulgaris TaxID=40348 RepID=A0A3P7LKH4_STRVU|nr:unnamed protein product [Strongylus vulgaris]
MLILNFLILLLVGFSAAFRKQGAAVKGKLFCGDKALKNAKVKLYDLDRNPGDPDDLLDEKYTDKNGEFAVTGTTRELTDIEPVLYIYHDCDDGIRLLYEFVQPCQKRITLNVPKRFIHGGTPKEWLDIGVVNVEMGFPEQDRSCNH